MRQYTFYQCPVARGIYDTGFAITNDTQEEVEVTCTFESNGHEVSNRTDQIDSGHTQLIMLGAEVPNGDYIVRFAPVPDGVVINCNQVFYIHVIDDIYEDQHGKLKLTKAKAEIAFPKAGEVTIYPGN